MKQGERQLEEFVTDVRTLVNDGGYKTEANEETMRDTLAFRINSNKARHDTFAVGNNLIIGIHIRRSVYFGMSWGTHVMMSFIFCVER